MLKKLPDAAGPNERPPQPTNARMRWLTLIFAAVILTPSMIGFVMKFIEFVHTFRSDAQGAFAIAPMANYLLASLGFLFMLLWAATNGSFTDMEAAKYTMLQRDLMLDENDH